MVVFGLGTKSVLRVPAVEIKFAQAKLSGEGGGKKQREGMVIVYETRGVLQWIICRVLVPDAGGDCHLSEEVKPTYVKGLTCQKSCGECAIIAHQLSKMQGRHHGDWKA